jgi:hypothetical protein
MPARIASGSTEKVYLLEKDLSIRSSLTDATGMISEILEGQNFELKKDSFDNLHPIYVRINVQ